MAVSRVGKLSNNEDHGALGVEPFQLVRRHQFVDLAEAMRGICLILFT